MRAPGNDSDTRGARRGGGARRLARIAVAALSMLPLAARPADYVDVPAGSLVSAIAAGIDNASVPVAAFSMRVVPVTQAEFKAFVAGHPQWRRDRVPRTFADASYLHSWRAAEAPEDAVDGDSPVVDVSWFAAEAYCESEDARLPTWMEWEYTAASDATRRDARDDPAWRAKILGWYARPASDALRAVGDRPNVYGVRDLHGLVWEWVDDFNALLVDADSRSGGDPDKLKFCGAGAIDLQDRANYAVLMRIALLSSLAASDSTGSLGFRCARPHPPETP